MWNKFNQFIIKLDRIPKSWEERTCLYCTYLICIKSRKSSTVKSYISAIKCVLRRDGYIWEDNKLLLNTITKSCKLKNDKVKTRLPIQLGLLDLIMYSIRRKYHDQPFLESLYITAYLFAYYGLMRVGELADSPHSLKAVNVHESRDLDKLLIVLYSSKTHGPDSLPQKIRIIGNKFIQVKNNNETFNHTMVRKKLGKFCPVEWARHYIRLRGPTSHDDENLLIFSDKSNLQSHHLRNLLREILASHGLDSNLYDTHSFRIGRASDLMKDKVSVEEIKQLGRWKSNAVYKYLRH